jgi:capsular polysaccharide biosynthesis protein
MRNRPALIAALAKLGVVAVQPETLSFDDQARLLAGADLVVSEFGAVMTNVAFCRPGTRVVEIIPEGQNDPWSVRLCAALGLEHVVLFHKVRDEDRETVEIGGRTHNKIFFKYTADVELVTRVVAQM